MGPACPPARPNEPPGEAAETRRHRAALSAPCSVASSPAVAPLPGPTPPACRRSRFLWGCRVQVPRHKAWSGVACSLGVRAMTLELPSSGGPQHPAVVWFGGVPALRAGPRVPRADWVSRARMLGCMGRGAGPRPPESRHAGPVGVSGCWQECRAWPRPLGNVCGGLAAVAIGAGRMR
jgi:hypothetical protein